MTWIILLGILFVTIIAHFFLQKSGVLLRPSLYRKKGRAMNESEQALYINLQKTLGDRYIILSKIRIEDFVEAVKGRGHYGARGRIKSRHVDFLSEKPFFLTGSITVGKTAGHTDVSLWYVLTASADDPIHYDPGEFNGHRWFPFDEILSSDISRFDPHLHRFIMKLKAHRET